jgi:hypothetical protein
MGTYENRTALLIGNEQHRKLRIYAANEGSTMQSSIDYIIDKFFHDACSTQDEGDSIYEELVSDYQKSVDEPQSAPMDVTEETEKEEDLVEGSYGSDDLDDILGG